MARRTIYNDIVTDEDYAKVNEDNKMLLEEFLIYIESIGRAKGTIINYMSDIKICFIWCLHYNENKYFIDFSKREIMKYQRWLKNDLQLSSSRIRRLKSSISSMSNFIETILDEEFPNFRNIVNSIPSPPNKTVRKKTVFEDEDIERLLEDLSKDGLIQEACCLALAVYNGSRKSELTRYKVSYFDEKNKIVNGALYITPEKIKTKGMGDHKIEKYTLAKQFDKYLKPWLDERKRLGIDNEYLFVTMRDGEWERAKVSTLDSWAVIFNKYTDKHFYWHSCRHYFTTHLSQNNLPAEIIRKIVGWASVDMVSLYNDSELTDELTMYFDSNGIKDIKKGSVEDV